MNPIQSLDRHETTEFIYDSICFSAPTEPNTPADVRAGIDRAMALDSRPVFLEGLCKRLNALGVCCSADDMHIMLSEVKNRFRTKLKKNCPRAVQNWVRGVTPGTANRLNHFDLCYALEMDLQQTADFFQKYFLTIPFQCKSRIDAIFLYCLSHNKPYTVVQKMLDTSEDVVLQDAAHTSTSQIFSAILETDDDEKFLQYLSGHCYGNQQQFQLARSHIAEEVALVKQSLLSQDYTGSLSPTRLNSSTIAELIGSKYQQREKKISVQKLPRRFTESLPNDVTLGRILNGETASYELLRKTLMLLKFYNFYDGSPNVDENSIAQNLMDFYDELNAELNACGFAQIYEMHPFDCLLLYCANSYDPILALQLVNEQQFGQ